MRYNILALGKLRINLFNITEDELKIVVSCYLQGKSKMTIAGSTYEFDNINEFQIFYNDSGYKRNAFEGNKDDWASGGGHMFGVYYTPDDLCKYGNNITKDIIGHKEYGSEALVEAVIPVEGLFVNPNRIDELRKIKSDNFDLSKLITMCNELNSNWTNKNYFTVALLLRSIVNHIPPIFGAYISFDHVVGQYGGASFKKNAKVLNESLRSIADSYTHGLIRKKEPLPNVHQIDFKQNFDFLLMELVAILN